MRGKLRKSQSLVYGTIWKGDKCESRIIQNKTVLSIADKSEKRAYVFYPLFVWTAQAYICDLERSVKVLCMKNDYFRGISVLWTLIILPRGMESKENIFAFQSLKWTIIKLK